MSDRTRRLLLSVPLALLLSTSTTHAAEILVSTISDAIADDARCSLREAIEAANTDTAVDTCTEGSGADTVVLAFDSDHTMAVAGANEDLNQTGDFDIREDLTIRPMDESAVVAISAAGLDRVFQVFDGADLTLVRIQVPRRRSGRIWRRDLQPRLREHSHPPQRRADREPVDALRWRDLLRGRDRDPRVDGRRQRIRLRWRCVHGHLRHH